MAGKCSEMDVSEVCEAKGATVHGVLIGKLSPVKESRSTVGVRYFEGQFSDGKKTVRIMVEFSVALYASTAYIQSCARRTGTP